MTIPSNVLKMVVEALEYSEARIEYFGELLGEEHSLFNEEYAFPRINDAIAALRPYMENQGWQDISTAPKDKIIFLANTEYAEFYCRFHKGNWCFWGIDDFDSMSWMRLSFKPTHWMPLPEPPK